MVNRAVTRSSAVFRDNGLCMMCKWIYGLTTPYQEVHHVFSRGKSIKSIKEYPSSLMSVCRSCHPNPILVLPTQDWQFAVLTVWRNMNCSPENVLYKQDPQLLVYNPIGLPTFKIGDGVINNWSK